MKTLAFLAIAGSALAAAIPSAAAAQAIERYVEVFGNDPCPVSGDGEITVCARKPESDRFRIPEKLRGQPGTAASTAWASRASALEYVGASGQQSCSAAGQGGWSGCWSQLMKQAREEAKRPAQDTTAAGAR